MSQSRVTLSDKNLDLVERLVETGEFRSKVDAVNYAISYALKRFLKHEPNAASPDSLEKRYKRIYFKSKEYSPKVK